MSSLRFAVLVSLGLGACASAPPRPLTEALARIARHGMFPYLYLRLDAREGAGGPVDRERLQTDETRAAVKPFVLPATPPSGEAEILRCCWGQGDTYERRDGAWVLTSSGRFEI